MVQFTLKTQGDCDTSTTVDYLITVKTPVNVQNLCNYIGSDSSVKEYAFLSGLTAYRTLGYWIFKDSDGDEVNFSTYDPRAAKDFILFCVSRYAEVISIIDLYNDVHGDTYVIGF